MVEDRRRWAKTPGDLVDEVAQIRSAVDEVANAPSGFSLPVRYAASVHPTLPMMIVTDTRTGRQANVRLSAYKDVRAALACLIGDRDEKGAENAAVEVAPVTADPAAAAREAAAVPADPKPVADAPSLASVVERRACRLVLGVFPHGGQQAYRVLIGADRDQEIAWVRYDAPKKFVLLDIAEKFPKSIHTSLTGALARLEGVLLPAN